MALLFSGQVTFVFLAPVNFRGVFAYFFLLGVPFDCFFILLFLFNVLIVAKNVTYQMMMDWSSPSHPPLEHVDLFILFLGSGATLSDDATDHVTSITHSNFVFNYSAEPFGL